MRKNGIIGNKCAKTVRYQVPICSQGSGICNLEFPNGKMTILFTLMSDEVCEHSFCFRVFLCHEIKINLNS